MDKIKKTRIPRKLSDIRSELIYYTRERYDNLTLEEIGMIFRVDKGFVHRALEKKGRSL